MRFMADHYDDQRRVGRLGTGRHRDVDDVETPAETWRDAAEAIFTTASTPAPHPSCPPRGLTAGEQDAHMRTWEYLIVALPPFNVPSGSRARHRRWPRSATRDAKGGRPSE